jgi:cell shape-determining protein MreC
MSMEESVKEKLVVLLAVLAGIFFITSISSCAKIKGLKRLKDDEMLERLTCQEEVKNIKDGMVSDLKSRQKELEDERTSHESTKKALAQEQLVNQSLKEELQKVTKLKEALEEALVNCRKSIKK